MAAILSTTLLRSQSDQRLLLLARQGHERAFEAIVERYRLPLERYCYRLLSDACAEDVVQQVFLNAWAALNAGTEVQTLRAWLFRIAHNTALNTVRQPGHDHEQLRESLPAQVDLQAELERRSVVHAVLVRLATIPRRQREALVRTALAGSSRSQVARELHLSEGAVRQLVHRARQTLRRAATAITPLPLASWATQTGARSAPLAQRVAELADRTAPSGLPSGLARAGAVVLAAALVAGGPLTLQGARHHGTAKKELALGPHPAAGGVTGTRQAASQTSGIPTTQGRPHVPRAVDGRSHDGKPSTGDGSGSSSGPHRQSGPSQPSPVGPRVERQAGAPDAAAEPNSADSGDGSSGSSSDRGDPSPAATVTNSGTSSDDSGTGSPNTGSDSSGSMGSGSGDLPD